MVYAEFTSTHAVENEIQVLLWEDEHPAICFPLRTLPVVDYSI